MNIPMFPRDLVPGAYLELPQPAVKPAEPQAGQGTKPAHSHQQQQQVDPYRHIKDQQAMMQQPQM